MVRFSLRHQPTTQPLVRQVGGQVPTGNCDHSKCSDSTQQSRELSQTNGSLRPSVVEVSIYNTAGIPFAGSEERKAIDFLTSHIRQHPIARGCGCQAERICWMHRDFIGPNRRTNRLQGVLMNGHQTVARTTMIHNTEGLGTTGLLSFGLLGSEAK